jgi:branched-chain amino acid transport system permease protein
MFGSPYLVSTGVFIGISTMLTLGLCLLMGYAGQISLKRGVYGLGAYTSAILTVKLGALALAGHAGRDRAHRLCGLADWQADLFG